MRKFLFVLSLALVSVLYLSSSASSEENFTISVDPGWFEEKETNCKTITDNSGNVTAEYEECDDYLEYETNLTNYLLRCNSVLANGFRSPCWSIGGDGTFFNSWYGRYIVTPNSLNSTFVFSLHGTNFSKNIEYTFSYVVYTHFYSEEIKITLEESQMTLAESQVTFFGNDSIETNLSGTFNGGIAIDSYYVPEDEETLLLKDECIPVFVDVKLEGTNVSTGNLSLSETYSSGGFFLNDMTREKCGLGDAGDSGFTPSLHFVVVLMVIFFVSINKTKINR
tara:strand:- start:163 stop:1002 length:840 start_codon:yes stop_codon:yes gene_type:complete